MKGRETVDGSTTSKLAPPKTLLYSRMAETFHRKFHDFGSPVYIRTQILESGYYMPGIVKKLKSLQDKCPSCRKRVRKKLHSAMGAVGRNRLTYSAPISVMQAHLVGPISIKVYVNERGTRKIWLLTGVFHFSHYISLTVVESLSKESILNALKLHSLRFGVSREIQTDFGTNFGAAKETIEAEQIMDDDIKRISQERSDGISLIQRSLKAPFIQGGIERANSMIKKILPGKKMTIFQLILLCEFVMFHVNRRPIGATSPLEHIRPADILPVWSQTNPATTMKECTKVVAAAKDEFLERWNELYKLSVRVSGWRQSFDNGSNDEIELP